MNPSSSSSTPVPPSNTPGLDMSQQSGHLFEGVDIRSEGNDEPHPHSESMTNALPAVPIQSLDSPSSTSPKKNPMARGVHKVVKRGKHVADTAVEVGKHVGHTTVEVGKKVGHTAVVVGKKGTQLAGSVFSDFKKFLNGRNVFDLAVGVVMGAAFTAAVTAVVNDVFNPILALMFSSKNLQNSYVIVRCPSNQTDCGLGNWATPALAQAAGAVTFNWGDLLLSFINLALVCVVVFFIFKLYSATFRRKTAAVAATKKSCPFCMNDVPIKATKCGFCISDLPQAPEADTVTVDITDSQTKSDHVSDDDKTSKKCWAFLAKSK